MPETSRRVFATHTGRFSKTVAAPLRYVYDWCTDFRTDDGKFSKSKPRYRVLKLAPDRVVRVRYSNSRAKQFAMAVEVIRLRPPNSWHVDQIDEADIEAVDYKLSSLGPKKTRIVLDIVERWMVPKFPPKTAWMAGTSLYWDRLAGALEDHYQKGLPARG